MERVGISKEQGCPGGWDDGEIQGRREEQKETEGGKRTVKTKNYKSRQLKHKPTQENRGLSQNEEPTFLFDT